jgi:uncharacterized membrane protein YdbT with pleckstrin-like domain
MGYVENNLMAGERVVFQTRLHPIIFLSPACFILAGLAVGLAADSRSGLLVLVLGALVLLGTWVRQMASEFAVTNRRVVIKTGWISRRTIELNMSKVESVEVTQGLAARLLNYGTILVIGTGGTKEPFDLIADPLGFRRAVQAQQS